MESQDGITVRPMRLKVLYTFDDENKSNCLARWPHVLDIQTAYLDEKTPIGVIELKTCIQAIVSASPELVAQLGRDYTVYAYDYSEYETPMVGQGMLSWVLASASPTPEAPAHQSKTMVTGRVRKNPLGLFSKGAQETLEVKLRLVPVPTVMQSEYLDSMQKYRELSNVIPHDFDAQSWTNFVRQNPALMESSRSQQPDRAGSPMAQSGIERFHQLLSEGSTPRDLSGYTQNESVRSVSPTHSFGAPSRVSTPGGNGALAQQQQQQQQAQSRHIFPSSDIIRPSSSASMRDADYHAQSYHVRRGSVQSGYGSGVEDSADPQPRKRAKLYQASWPGKSDMNIERQPSSLRVAASTAASVRIHRPTPVNPSIAAEHSNEEPVRPPTPISRPGEMPRRARPSSSLLRESSIASTASYASPYFNSDDILSTEQTAHSPEDPRYQGLFEPSFTMPSSPPILDNRLPSKSSPNLPPISLDTDSGFMSGGLDDYHDEAATPVEDRQRAESQGITDEKQSRSVRSTVQPSPAASTPGFTPDNANDMAFVNNGSNEHISKKTPAPQSRPVTSSGSRPCSRSSSRPTPKPLAPAPMSQADVSHLLSALPASDPVAPTHPPLQHAQTWSGPMSDFTAIEASIPPGNRRSRNAACASKRSKQIQTRLDQAIKTGQVPPYCQNCGAIETPSWRRSWSKEIDGNEELAQEMMKDNNMLFYKSIEKDSDERTIKFKIYKKTLVDSDIEWDQVLLCNPCGLWLHKCKSMRPENMWNKQHENKKKKRPVRNRTTGGPLSRPTTRSFAAPSLTAASSPAATEASSVPAEEGITPHAGNDHGDQDQDHDDEAENYPNKRRRANSAEPPRSTETAKDRWDEHDALEALRRAIQSSPARNMEPRPGPATDDNTLTPKPVRRALFPAAQNDGPLKELDSSFINSSSPRRSPRFASREDKRAHGKENHAPTPPDNDLDGLFENPPMDFDLPASPTPRRRHPRMNAIHERRHSLPCNSPTNNRRKEVGPTATPARLTAQRLQRIQECQEAPRSSPRQNRSPNKHGFPQLSDGGLHSEAFESIDDMMLDIFDDAPGPSDSFQLENPKFAGDGWADWLPSNYVSPTGSDDGNGPADDLLSAILSDPAVLKENLHNSNFDPFNFVGPDMPDSGFFSSDAFHSDSMNQPLKAQSSSERPSDPQTTTPSS
ncbi:uncharacterized protein N7459_003195 [Penicillium hispanicum]|uniref:uncharacterized protein n=1 Tax=Penicillium hispanicum TaxID=1080232 RepID=UPI00254119BB|nr:uncharacterized protein N7459_003195 [Penicillium hispanicum]KAJ5587430.1 hypothetical protein N7459_003195 [Penicillium hispanicum]